MVIDCINNGPCLLLVVIVAAFHSIFPLLGYHDGGKSFSYCNEPFQ
jgi:hypothetical protein